MFLAVNLDIADFLQGRTARRFRANLDKVFASKY
jgi:hypothetical protein